MIFQSVESMQPVVNVVNETAAALDDKGHTTVELICTNDMMDAILDRFGKDVTTEIHDEEHFSSEVDVVVSNVFFAWVFGFNGEVIINGPADVRQQYSEMVRKAVETIDT